nr:MAG TPA_asm: Poxvirus A21 Protein [Bacteriophage sp.]
MLQFIDNHKTIMISLYILISLLVIIYNIIPQ